MENSLSQFPYYILLPNETKCANELDNTILHNKTEQVFWRSSKYWIIRMEVDFSLSKQTVKKSRIADFEILNLLVTFFSF